MEWTQRVLAVGEAFSGSECASLRTLLERQSGKFFRLYHHSNIEVHYWLCVHGDGSSRCSYAGTLPAATGCSMLQQSLLQQPPLPDVQKQLRLCGSLRASCLPSCFPPLTGAEQHA